MSLLMGVTRWMPSLGLLGEAHKTTGIVVGIHHWTESGETIDVPQVQFTTENGQQISIIIECPPFDCFADYGIGSKVPVIYPNNYPEFAIADTLAGRLWTPLFFLIIGLVFTIAGSVGFVMEIRERRKSFSPVKLPINLKSKSTRHLLK